MSASGPASTPDLDAVLAAPRHHRILFENERVRVLDTTIEPGETVPLHTHRWPATYFIVHADHFVRRDALGQVQADTRTHGAPPRPGTAMWSPPLGPHTLENVGTTRIQVIVTELKDA